MSLNIIIVLVCIFALLQNAKGSAANSKVFMKEVTQCCQHAMKEVAKQANPNCEAIGRQTAENVISGLICRTSAELCCVKQSQETSCNSGTAVARNGGRCTVDTTLNYGTEDRHECCYCCYLGMEAKRRNMGCGKSAILGFPCQRAFLRCCLLRNPITFPPVIPTNPPRRTCSSLACSQSCVVRNGVPRCECRRGFQLNRNGRSCDDENECARRGTTCDQDKVCKNTYGSYLCVNKDVQKVSCPVGLEADSSGKQCQDINECQDSPCKAHETCINSRGSYECRSRCPSAYVFRNGRCEKDCSSGYLWDGTRCVDKDECQQAGICQNKRCENTDGSYRCVSQIRCGRGYERVGQECKDIDECVKYGSRRLCNRLTCVNRPGSYKCVRPRRSCRRGYELVNFKCQDIDECKKNLCQPDEQCINRPGTYRCEKRSTCRRGYRFNGTACEDVNECLDPRQCPADKECINTIGNYRCSVKCSLGYEKIQEDCRDINECEVGNPCRSYEECQNVPGSYLCTRVAPCQSGHERLNGRCEDINECLLEDSVCRGPRSKCVNLPGSYRCEYTACLAGFVRDKYGYCVDINECVRGGHICKAGAEECINLNGTYSCRCNPGYILYAGDNHCRDKDECDDAICQHKCINTEGSFRCECRKGYALADKRNCLDVDECKQRGTCQHTCVNTQGSYYCRCNRGFSLQSNGASCQDINECQKPEEYRQCVYRCRNNLGSYSCICPSGYQRRYFKYCLDIDECGYGRSPCGSNEVCINTRGGHKCLRLQCPNSYFTQRTSVQCTRKSCRLNDAGCRAEKRKSIRWHWRDLPNDAKPGAFAYFYNITTAGYRRKPRIHFSIKSGNYGNVFTVYNHGYGRASIKNSRVLKGPREYKLEFSGEVINKDRIVTARFVTYLYVYVSQYNF